MSAALLSVRDLARSFYGVQALHGVTFDVMPGTITALIGPNGAGKTTAFQCITGVVPPDGGSVMFDGRNITGWRADRITRAGLTRVFNILEGFEGEIDAQQHRGGSDGWRFQGLPWVQD